MNVRAKEGYVFICQLCGKRSHDKYGDEAIDYGWDVACSIHCAERPRKLANALHRQFRCPDEIKE